MLLQSVAQLVVPKSVRSVIVVKHLKKFAHYLLEAQSRRIRLVLGAWLISALTTPFVWIGFA